MYLFLFVYTIRDCAHTACPIFEASFQGDLEWTERLCVCVCVFFRTGDLYCIQSSFAFVKIQFRFFDFRAILFSLHLTFDARICWCQNHLLYEHNTHRERNIHVHSSVSLCVCMSVRGLRTLSHCASHTRMHVTK